MDIVALAAGAAATFRFWYVFFAIQSYWLTVVVAAACVSEIAYRIVTARYRWERPRIFGLERRFDVVAAIILTTGPWPIALPMNDGSPLGSAWQSVALPDWLAFAAAVCVLGVCIKRIVVSLRMPYNGPRPSMSWRRVIAADRGTAS